MADYPPAQPHGCIEQLQSDVYWVQGSVRMGHGMTINRNMVLLRHDGEITVLNAVRLDPAAETALERLGTVKRVVRAGYFHGMDDPYFVKRFGAEFWCQQGAKNPPSLTPDVVIDDQTSLPVPDAELFLFRETKHPECAVLVNREGGLLITCDSVQHHTGWPRCSIMAKLVMLLMGFKKPANIGPMWRKAMTAEGGTLRPDFERLLELEFDQLLGAHGVVCTSGARDALAATVRRVFG